MLNNLQLMRFKKSNSKRAIPKTSEATGDLIGSKIANKITGVSRNLQQNNSETVVNENNKGIFKDIHLKKKDRK